MTMPASGFIPILSYVARHIELDRNEVDYFTSRLTMQSVHRRALIQEAGKRCTVISYVNSGALRAFYRDQDDKESTIMFAIADWWITDIHSFANKCPAMINIEAIEESNLVQISKTNLDLLFEKIPKFERLFRIMMQNAYIREQLRVLQNLSLTAEERYENFLKKYPRIVEKVTQKQIASYLGITPEFLSSIRKDFSNGKKS